MRRRSRPFATAASLLACALGVAGLAGCSAGVIAMTARDNNLTDLQHAMSLEGQPTTGPVNATGRPVLFAVAAQPRAVIAYDLGTKKVLWTHPAATTTRIVVGPRGVYAEVAGAGGRPGDLVGWDVRDGHVLFDVPPPVRGENVLGLAADATHLYYSIEGEAKGRRVSHLVALDAQTGGKDWDLPAPGSLGAPAVRGGAVFVPYLSQYVSVVDAAKGQEVARVRVKGLEVSYVRALPEGLYYGSTGVFTLTDRSVTGTKEGSTYTEAALPRFVRPVYALDGYDPNEADYTAYDRNRLLWRGAGGDQAGFAGGRVVVLDYRYLFGFDAGHGTLQWAYSSPSDLVGAVDTGRAIAFLSGAGDVGLVDAATGAYESLGSLGTRVIGGTFDADGLAASGAGAPESLEKRLSSIIWDPDARFSSIKLFAIDALAKLPGAGVSADLLKIVEDPKVTAENYDRAGAALVARKDRAALPLYLDALGKHWDYVTGTQPRAVGVLARAVAALGARAAVPALLVDLQDPSTSTADLTLVAQSLTQIGAKEAVPAFRHFLLQYHADPLFQSDPTPLSAVADGLLALGGPEDRALLRYVDGDPRTLPKLRAYLDKALTGTAPSSK